MVSPAYVLRPAQIVRRLRLPSAGAVVVRLPWRDELGVTLDGQIGRGIARQGVYELATSEVLWRLTDPSDTALDVGANIGYFTSLLSSRAAAVIAFEPMPALRERLEENVTRWQRPSVTVDSRAVSSEAGEAQLAIPSETAHADGTATLVVTEAATAFSVQTTALPPADIAKIDVEGHEAAVLAGMGGPHVRDIVFEDHHAEGSDAISTLRGWGYSVFGLASSFWRVDLVDPLSPRARPRWEAPNYLATLDPDRARRRMSARGWRCLGH